jgi:1,6-anhydro-N-acetylmuramate kinase
VLKGLATVLPRPFGEGIDSFKRYKLQNNLMTRCTTVVTLGLVDRRTRDVVHGGIGATTQRVQ